MKNYIKIIIASVILVIINLTAANAQITKKAQVGFRFLENPISAEVMGRGGVGIIGGSSANSIFWNPALLDWNENGIDVALNHTKSIADINYNSGAAAVKIGELGVIGLSIIAMDYGDFYGTVRAANDKGYVETGTFSPTAFAAGIAFSKKVSDKFSYGVHLRYSKQNLGEAYISTGSSFEDSTFSLSTVEYDLGVLSLDVGAFYDFLYKGITFGITLQNISPEIKYEVQKFPLPFAIGFGATVEPTQIFLEENSNHRIIISVESRHARDFNARVKYGGEYRFVDRFIVRAGYQDNYDERDWTAGIGIKQNFAGHTVRVDYAIESFGLFGNRHFMSIGFGL